MDTFLNIYLVGVIIMFFHTLISCYKVESSIKGWHIFLSLVLSFLSWGLIVVCFFVKTWNKPLFKSKKYNNETDI